MKTSMTPDARAALESAGYSRREFLASSGALIVTFSLADLAGTPGTSATIVVQTSEWVNAPPEAPTA